MTGFIMKEIRGEDRFLNCIIIRRPAKWYIRQIKVKSIKKGRSAMPRRLQVRELNEKESENVQQTARSRTAAVRQVERARIILASSEGQSVGEIASGLQLKHAKVRKWIHRFNEQGLGGLEDEARAGRPSTYTAEEVSEVVAASLSDPQHLGLPFASWTLDRLEAYLNDTKGILIKRSRINDVLLREGLRWRQQESWFGERVAPDFAAKRG
jgi:transposase